MPTKLGKTEIRVDRATKKKSVVHPYIKHFSIKDLIEKYNNDNTRPRDRQKIKNELIRRGGDVFKKVDE